MIHFSGKLYRMACVGRTGCGCRHLKGVVPWRPLHRQSLVKACRIIQSSKLGRVERGGTDEFFATIEDLAAGRHGFRCAQPILRFLRFCERWGAEHPTRWRRWTEGEGPAQETDKGWTAWSFFSHGSNAGLGVLIFGVAVMDIFGWRMHRRAL